MAYLCSASLSLSFLLCAANIEAATFTLQSIDNICSVTISKTAAMKCLLTENIKEGIVSFHIVAVFACPTPKSAFRLGELHIDIILSLGNFRAKCLSSY